MAKEPKPESVSNPLPLPAPLGFYVVRFWRKIIQYLDLRLLTERLMTFLRLFASVGLLLIVIFVVYKVILSSRLVLVKPFAVPQTRAVDIETVTGNSKDYLLGTSIKLLETGSSINAGLKFNWNSH